MKVKNSVIKREKLRKENMTKEDVRKEKLKDEIKAELFNKNKIEKICRLSLGMLLIVTLCSLVLLTFKIVTFNLSEAVKLLVIITVEVLLIFITRLIQLKNRDIVLNKFLDAMDNKVKNKK